jgi:PAT family beta-lactamase induction signal transducer AmpG
MQSADAADALPRAEVVTPERPWLFGVLIAPDAVISLGLIDGGLSYLLRSQGVDPGRSASIIALLSLPHAIYLLWGPITDFWLRRRTWLMVAAVAAAATFVAAFQQQHLGRPRAVGLMFIGACVGVLVPAACGGLMGTLRDERNRRRAGSAYQIGSLAIGAVGVFALVSLSGRMSIASLGLVLAALIILPSLFAFASPPETMTNGHSAHETARHFWKECKTTFWRWDAIPYALLCSAPICSGALIGLLPGLAVDFGVTGQQVAWINGIGGALLTAAGAYAASLIPIRIRASVAFPIAGLVNAATAAMLAAGPQRPAFYLLGTVLFLFTIGAGYALFTGVVLEFLGGSGKSGSSRYAVINAIGNLPVVYMSWFDGRGYAFGGSRGMPATDAVLSATVAALMLVYFGVRSRRQQA